MNLHANWAENLTLINSGDGYGEFELIIRK
jgi:hypothetical protein